MPTNQPRLRLTNMDNEANTRSTLTLEQQVVDIQTRAWNKHISPHLDGLRQWFNEAAWLESVAPYLKEISEMSVDLVLMRPGDDASFLRGKTLMMRDLLKFPEVIKRQIDAKEKAINQPRPQGEAGY